MGSVENPTQSQLSVAETNFEANLAGHATVF
jgi:hypothetical protein